MTKKEKEELKLYLADYLQGKGIAINKPFKCINPEHNDEHPSMSFDKARNKVHCFACGCTYDLYDCIRLLEGFISDKEAFSYAEQTFLKRTVFVAVSNSDTKPKVSSMVSPKHHFGTLEGKWLKYIETRGISKTTADRFNLQSGRSAPVSKGCVWDCIVIPVKENSYVFRNIDESVDDKHRIRKMGASTLFNINALNNDVVFVVEGEFDALSIEEVGGNALALGSTSNYRQLLNVLKGLNKKPFIVLALDNDKEGNRATGVIAEELSKINIEFVTYNIAGTYKDANEALVKNRDEFAETIQELTSSEKELISDQKLSYSKNVATDILASIKSEDCVATGFKKLDDILDGGFYNELYVIGGGSSVGKTSFVLQIADQIATKRDVVYFSLEMSKRAIVSKSISRLTTENKDANARATARQITAKSISLTGKQQKAVDTAIDKYKTYGKNIYIIEGTTTLLTDIIAGINNHIHFTGNKPVVFIDYLQLLESDFKSTDKQNIDKCIKELKRAGRELEVPIIVISSFSRSGYKEEATMESFKESGSIEYSGDTLLALQFSGISNKGFKLNEAKKNKIRNVEIVVLKNRNGYTGETVKYEYEAAYNLFTEI